MKNINITVHHRITKHSGFLYLENPRRRERTFDYTHIGWKMKVRCNGVTVTRYHNEGDGWKQQNTKRLSLSEGRDLYAKLAHPGSRTRSVKVWHDDKLMCRKLATSYVPQTI